MNMNPLYKKVMEDHEMNRENKRKLYEKGYYKTHPCSDTFVCKYCGGHMEPVSVWVRNKGEWAILCLLQ